MILLIHITIALASLAYTSYVIFRPSAALLRGSYALIAATLATGTYLVIQSPSHLLQACTSGLIYVCAVTALTVAARHRLTSAATATEHHQD